MSDPCPHDLIVLCVEGWICVGCGDAVPPASARTAYDHDKAALEARRRV